MTFAVGTVPVYGFDNYRSLVFGTWDKFEVEMLIFDVLAYIMAHNANMFDMKKSLHLLFHLIVPKLSLRKTLFLFCSNYRSARMLVTQFTSQKQF